MSLALPAPDMARAITRISHEILERNSGSDSITLLGIPTRGAHLAARIAANIEAIEGKTVQSGTLDITLHRDDLRMRPPRALMPTTIPSLGVEDRNVILIDDVLFSGRTIRAALDALGDIGRHFSDTDAAYKNADSWVLLQKAVALVRNAGYQIGNVDCTVVAQAPKLAAYMPAMCQRIAQALDVEVSRVNVKAKTAEKIGPVGQGQSMEARAVALIY